MADSTGERNLKPSAKRIRDARKRGQVPRSRDLAGAMGLVAATAVLGGFGGSLLNRLGLFVAGTLERLDTVALAQLAAEDLSVLAMSSGMLIAVVVGPIAFAVVAAGVATSFAQGGFNFSVTPLQPKLQRLSPKSGLQRLKPSQSGIELIKAVVATTILAVLAWRVGQQLVMDVPRLVGASLTTTTEAGWDVIKRLLWQVGGALLALGAADYAIQRWRMMTSLKMTRQEVQQESKTEEGNPEVKGRVRRIRRDMARRRMLSAVANATVVITNPTHYAVALEYNREKHAAPLVLAKGRDLIAGRIREIARANNVPIVENPPLARALYSGAEIGDIVPAPLFGAVAEVLAYLVRIRQLML